MPQPTAAQVGTAFCQARASEVSSQPLPVALVALLFHVVSLTYVLPDIRRSVPPTATTVLRLAGYDGPKPESPAATTIACPGWS